MKQLFLFLFLAACALPAAAQDENIDTFRYRQNGVDILFQGVMVKSNDELHQIELFDAMYPVTIVPRPVLQKAVGIGNRQSILADSLTQAVLRYRDWETDRKSTRLNSSHSAKSRMPSSA